MLLRALLLAIQALACLGIIGLVLLQRGKGAEAGAGFGAGASGTVFGARGASTALSRATAILAAIFMINSLLLTYTATRAAATPQKTILDEAAPRTAPVSGNAAPGAPAGAPASAPAAPVGPAAPAGSAATPAPALPSPTTPAPQPATPQPAH